jgi:hypothetical protein
MKRHTTIASNCRLRASPINILSSGRESFAPRIGPRQRSRGQAQIPAPRSWCEDREVAFLGVVPSFPPKVNKCFWWKPKLLGSKVIQSAVHGAIQFETIDTGGERGIQASVGKAEVKGW